MHVYGLEGLVEERDGRFVVVRGGIVLIDEIDAHLHPQWPREIGFWLKERFPYVQFIVTTHSPLICQAADPGGLFRLPPSGSGEVPFQISKEDYDRIIRSKPETILVSPAFGMEHTRSPRAVEARRRYARLKAKQAAGFTDERDHQKMKQRGLFVDEEE